MFLSCFFFFKQKTAYEMRISDWSSDVCSSDLAPPAGVDHDAELVGVLLEAVADGEIAELGRVVVPLAGMAARPVSEGRGADIQRHADAVARVEASAAHLRQLPARPQVARPPLGIGLETAAGEHHSGCPKVVDAPSSEEHTSELQSLMRHS